MSLKPIRFIVIAILIFAFLMPLCPDVNTIFLLPGSNIYVRIFLFFFPISNEYEFFSNKDDNILNIEITIDKENIKNEPSTPSYFESNIVFYIKDIPYNKSGKFTLPLTIQCNKNFINKNVNFTVYKKKDILIIKGSLNDLYVKEITNNEYFKNRYKWKFPFYFDIRLQINDSLL